MKKILAKNVGLGQEKLSNFGHILMVKMRALIQRLNVECQKEINTESVYDFWSVYDFRRIALSFIRKKNGKGTF